MSKNTKISLKCIQQIELDLLLHFNKFCKENSLKYFLSNGTLLGAVKYKGFIPWDDDIDVFVPRKDYDRLIKIYTDSNRYKLFSPERDDKFAFPFAKLCDMTTRKEEINNNNGVELGIDIDIFPLDEWEENAEEQTKKQVRLMTLLRLSKNKKITGSSLCKRIAKQIVAFFCRCLGAPYFVKKLNHNAKTNQRGSTHKGCVIWPVYANREIVPADIFIDTVEVEFEGNKFPAPIGYDEYLRSLYGDYEKDPPLDKQKTHHRFLAYKI